MPDDAAIKHELERRTGWTPSNRRYHVSALAKKIGSKTIALYVRAHQAGVALARFGVDDETLLTVGGLAEDNPPPSKLDQAGISKGNGKSSGRRRVSTIMFLDIVDSTNLRSRLGNRRYLSIRSSLQELRERLLRRHSGNLIKDTGDGFLATFTLPTNGVRCALELAEAANELSIDVRVGLHTAELLFRDGDIDGLGVHIASRIEAAAEPGQVLVSSTVQGVLAGSEFKFTSAGQQELKGVSGKWELFVAGA